MREGGRRGGAGTGEQKGGVAGVHGQRQNVVAIQKGVDRLPGLAGVTAAVEALVRPGEYDLRRSGCVQKRPNQGVGVQSRADPDPAPSLAAVAAAHYSLSYGSHQDGLYVCHGSPTSCFNGPGRARHPVYPVPTTASRGQSQACLRWAPVSGYLIPLDCWSHPLACFLSWTTAPRA